MTAKSAWVLDIVRAMHPSRARFAVLREYAVSRAHVSPQRSRVATHCNSPCAASRSADAIGDQADHEEDIDIQIFYRLIGLFNLHQIRMVHRQLTLSGTAEGARRCAPGDNPTEDPAMSDMTQPNERIPAMQHLLENPFLLLFLGVAVPTVIYIVWGVMEIVNIPIAK